MFQETRGHDLREVFEVLSVWIVYTPKMFSVVESCQIPFLAGLPVAPPWQCMRSVLQSDMCVKRAQNVIQLVAN